MKMKVNEYNSLLCPHCRNRMFADATETYAWAPVYIECDGTMGINSLDLEPSETAIMGLLHCETCEFCILPNNVEVTNDPR